MANHESRRANGQLIRGSSGMTDSSLSQFVELPDSPSSALRSRRVTVPATERHGEAGGVVHSS